MENRETKELTLEITGKKVIYYAYIKAKEMRAATGLKKTDDGNEITDNLIKILVVSIGEIAGDKVLEEVLDLPIKDYSQLSSALTALITVAIEEKKN